MITAEEADEADSFKEIQESIITKFRARLHREELDSWSKGKEPTTSLSTLVIGFLFLFGSLGLLYKESLLRRTPLIQAKAGLASYRGEIVPRQVTPLTYREALKEMKKRQIFNLIIELKHLSLFFRIVSRIHNFYFPTFKRFLENELGITYFHFSLILDPPTPNE